MATTRQNLDYIDEQPRGIKFYCPRTATYNLSRAEAKKLARDGFDVIAENDLTLSVQAKACANRRT